MGKKIDEKTNLVSNSTSGVLRANDIKDLIDYVSADNFNGDYTEELFEEFVENIIVNSRDELTFANGHQQRPAGS